MSTTIAITGATGFIGSNLCQLLLDKGYTLRALARSESAARILTQQDVACIRGSLDDQESLKNLVEGTAAVVHLAGSVRGVNQQQFDRVNVRGVRQLLQVLETTRMPPRLLSVSSLAAREPTLSFYAASKRRGEQVLEQEAHRVNWSVLRPPAVYGPGDTELMPLFRLASRGYLPVAGDAKARFSLLFVDDLSRAILAWLESDTTSQGIYALHDGAQNGYDWYAIAAIIQQLRGRQVRLITVPRMMLDLVASVNNTCARVLRYAPMLTPAKVRELRHPNWVCENAKLEAMCNWQPSVPLAEGLQLTPELAL